MVDNDASANKGKKWLFNFFVNIGTSGRYTEKSEFGMSDYLIRYVLLNFIILFGVSILSVFTVMNFKLERYFTAVVCISMIMVALTSFILARTKIPQFIPALILVIFYGLLCIMVTWVGEADGANFLFIYMFPSLTIMLLGMRNGITMSLILIALIAVEMFVPNVSRFHYGFDFSIRMLVNYILVFSVMIVVETTRKTKDRLIEIQGREMQGLKELAETASRTKSNFLASMSHEIRTPMNAVIGIAQIELQKGNLQEEYAIALDKIYNSGNNLLGIINDILDMSKIETGKMELNPLEYDVPSLINDAVQINIVRIGSKQIEFTLYVDENLPSKLYGDELRLKQILNNLLSNAIKYTGKGMVKLSVACFPQGETPVAGDIMLRFTVEDSGQGMKGEDLERLFSEYSRFNVEANRATEGTGLGLNITKKLIEMMGGAVEVKSEYGKGSVFTVTIPQQAVECPVIGAELAHRLCNFTFTGSRQSAHLHIIREPMPYGSVLVVDDVETNLYVAEGMLLPYKLNIETAISGFAAIEKIENGKTYDIIFMDHMMPKMDGIETTEKLRQRGYTGVIIALTANALTGNDEMFSQHGFDGFIPKPIDIRHLNAVLNRFIRDRYPQEAEKYKPTVTEPSQSAPAQTAAPQDEISAKLRQIFRRDAEKAVVTLRETAPRSGAGADAGDIKLFTTTVHAMKSALTNIGEAEKSQLAAALEQAGIDGDRDFIAANTENFITKLESLIGELSSVEAASPAAADVAEDTAYLAEQLHIIKNACAYYDDTAAFAALDRLKEKQWKPETADALEKIRDMLFLHSDFDGAAERAGGMICA